MPDAGRQVLGVPRHDADVENRLVRVSLQVAEDEYVSVLEDEALAGGASAVGTRITVIHPVIPVRQHVPGELGA